MSASAWTAIGSIVSYCLIIGGWFFVRRDNNRREKRKELRVQLDTATREVDAIAADAKELLTIPGVGPTAVLKREKILAGLKVLAVRVQVVSYTYTNFSVARQLVLFRQAATGAKSGFDDVERDPFPEDDVRVIEVFRTAGFLKVSIELQYHGVFRAG